MASSSSEAAPPVAAGEDPAAPAKGEERAKKEKTRVVLPQIYLDTLMRAGESLEPLPQIPGPDEEFVTRVREQRAQKGFVEIELTDDDEDEEEEEGGNAAPPAAARGSMEEEDRSSPEVTKKPGGGGGSGIKKLS